MKTLVCILLIAVCAISAPAADVSGKWSGEFIPEGQEASPAVVILKQTGSTVTGSAGPNGEDQWPLSDGKLLNNRLTGLVTAPNGATYKLDLVLEGDHIKGTIVVTRDGDSLKASIDVTRAKS